MHRRRAVLGAADVQAGVLIRPGPTGYRSARRPLGRGGTRPAASSCRDGPSGCPLRQRAVSFDFGLGQVFASGAARRWDDGAPSRHVCIYAGRRQALEGWFTQCFLSWLDGNNVYMTHYTVLRWACSGKTACKADRSVSLAWRSKALARGRSGLKLPVAAARSAFRSSDIVPNSQNASPLIDFKTRARARPSLRALAQSLAGSRGTTKPMLRPPAHGAARQPPPPS